MKLNGISIDKWQPVNKVLEFLKLKINKSNNINMGSIKFSRDSWNNLELSNSLNLITKTKQFYLKKMEARSVKKLE